jgi:hypothetical protein
MLLLWTLTKLLIEIRDGVVVAMQGGWSYGRASSLNLGAAQSREIPDKRCAGFGIERLKLSSFARPVP